MIVTGTQTHKVDVPERHILDLAIEIVKRRNSIGDMWLSPDGKQVLGDEDSRHGSVGTVMVREATDADRAAFTAISVLRELQR